MNVTQRIAAVLGPALVAVTLSEALNLDIWAGVHPAVVYLNGLIFFVGGIFIVTAHNRWRTAAERVVTGAGVLLAAAGAYRMFFPTAPQMGPSGTTYLVIGALGLLGVLLSLIALVKR